MALALDCGVVVDKVNIAWPLSVAFDKIVVPGRTLAFRVARQHALDAHADTLGALDRTPALVSKQIEAYDAIGVYMGVHRDRTVWTCFKRGFWRFCQDAC